MKDKELVIRIRQGNSEYFREIVQKYNGMMFSKVLSLVHHEDVAAEITQQAFIKGYENLSCWTGETLGGWLLTIAYHLALNVIEEERRTRKEDLENVNLVEETYSEEHEQLLQKMEKAIDSLPELDKTILKLHYYQHKLTNDIATVLGLSQANVLMRLHRIRERLKKQLENEDNIR
ncbi:MAG: RNA polymerase sigma factor [Bacteroidaceae bacterium]|jgi:RNA polymerase sigma-70 factor (ECF subfamily)|nr:RNA polymerase sigma factor [Bacteroidaceae bacterium]